MVPRDNGELDGFVISVDCEGREPKGGGAAGLEVYCGIEDDTDWDDEAVEDMDGVCDEVLDDGLRAEVK